jgi:hypothetical protein
LLLTLTLLEELSLAWKPLTTETACTIAQQMSSRSINHWSAVPKHTALFPNPSLAQHSTPSRFSPTSKSKQVELEVWLLCLGSPDVPQLDVLPENVTGLPSVFEYHPFCFINFEEQARIRKQATQRSSVCTTDCRHGFYMDFGFMQASTSDYSHPHKGKDHVVKSYDGYTSYLLIVDETT